MASQKPSTRRRTIAVCLAVLVALLVLIPWGWGLYQKSKSTEVQIREAIEELVVDMDGVPRTRVMEELGRFLDGVTGRRTEGDKKREAVEKLFGFGTQAFAILAECFEDDRPGYNLAGISNPTVGVACYYIVLAQLFEFPAKYSSEFLRQGADGKSHPRSWTRLSLFGGSPDALKNWLNQRKGRSLEEHRFEVLEGALAEEEKIGVTTAEDEEKYLAPLRRKIAEKRRAIEAQPKP